MKGRSVGFGFSEGERSVKKKEREKINLIKEERETN